MDVYEEFTKDRYGSFELRKYLARYLWIGLAVSVGLHGTAIGSYVLGLALTREPPSPKRIVILDASKLGAPPSITDKTVPPTIKVAHPRMAPIAAAKPVAVPDEEDKEEITDKDNEEKSDKFKELSEDKQILIKEADNIYNESKEAMKNGEWARYGELIEQLGNIIDK